MREDIKGVAFDLDGTLYPNYRIHVKLIPFTLKELRLLLAFGKARKIIRKEQEESLQGGSQKSIPYSDFYMVQAEIIAKLLSKNPEQTKEKIDRLIYAGWEPLFKTVKLFDEIPQILDELRKAGYKLGLLSDFPIQKKLEYVKLAGCWDAELCSEHCGALKPHPESFKALAEKMSLPPQNILYVGNSYSYDVAGAARAGMKTAWLRPVFHGGKGKKPKPDFSFTNYRQFKDFMLK